MLKLLRAREKPRSERQTDLELKWFCQLLFLRVKHELGAQTQLPAFKAAFIVFIYPQISALTCNKNVTWLADTTVC